MKAARDSWVKPVIALALCASVSALFSWLKTPLPWMIGPLLTMAAGNFSGAGLRSIPGSLGRYVGTVLVLLNATAPVYGLARRMRSR